MNSKATNAHTIAALIEQLGRQVQNLCFTRELAPVQWSALRYFAKVGPSARTVSGLAAYSGVNLSSASRTIQLLHKKGLAEISAVPGDNRVRRVSLTSAGRALLERDPLYGLAEAADEALNMEEQTGLSALLEKLLFQLCPRPFRGP